MTAEGLALALTLGTLREEPGRKSQSPLRQELTVPETPSFQQTCLLPSSDLFLLRSAPCDGLSGKPCIMKLPDSSSCSPITHPPCQGCCISTCHWEHGEHLMDYGWINSNTEHMRTLQPRLCLPRSCSVEGVGLLGRSFRA